MSFQQLPDALSAIRGGREGSALGPKTAKLSGVARALEARSKAGPKKSRCDALLRKF
jgi:hypothetical protein